MQMGIEFEKALRELPERTGLVTLNILVTALSVHQQMGGDLVTVLQRLSETIRDRLLFLGRLKAATIASRATAVLMITLPLVIFTFFAIREPDYLSRLMASSWGRGSTALAVILQILGSFWVLRVLKTSQQG
jgi:tight adherence protein B